jgi:alpha-1,3-rhamnosyl/mannosyltransferase
VNKSDRPLRVAFNGVPLLSPLTGIGQYSKSLLQGLDARADVSALKFYATGWSDQIRDKELPVVTQRWKSVVRKLIPNAYSIARYMQQSRFTEGLTNFKPDLYHEPNFLAYRFDGPSVITVHDLSWIRYPEMHPVERVRAMDKFFEPGLRRASRVITDSQFVKQELIEVFGIRPEIIHPVLLGADDLFQPQDAAQTQPVLQGLSLTHGRYLLAVGTLEPRKNLQVALEAFASLPASLRERFPLVLVGMKGWKTSALEQKLAPMVASGQVRQLGYLSRQDLATVMAGATAMVYPSVYEGFGLPPLESMACGVPVIASNVSSIPEVVGDCGLLIDPADAQALALKMAQLLEDEVLRSQLADRALARSQLFSWAKCTDQTVDVYKAAVA